MQCTGFRRKIWGLRLLMRFHVTSGQPDWYGAALFACIPFFLSYVLFCSQCQPAMHAHVQRKCFQRNVTRLGSEPLLGSCPQAPASKAWHHTHQQRTIDLGPKAGGGRKFCPGHRA